MSEQVDHKVVIDSTPETTSDGVDFKVDLNNPPKPKEDAIQEQETEGSVLRDSEESESAGQDTEVGLLQTHDKTEQMIILIIFVSFKKGMILIMQYYHELIMDK